MQHSCSHYNAFRNIPWQIRTYLRTWQHQMTTMKQPFQCNLQPEIQEPHRTTHTDTTTRCKTHRRNNSRTKRPQPHPPHTRGTFHRRLPLYTEKHKVSCSGFLPKTKPMQHSCSHSNAICNQRFKNRIELRTQTQRLVAKHIGGTIRAQNDRSRTRRTDEVPFIAGCSHFTRKNTRFRAPASSPTHPFPSSPLPIVTTSHRHRLPSSPLPFLTTSLPHHFPSSPPPFLTASHRHHFPSSPLPFVTTSLRHRFPSSPLPFVTTSVRHHFPSSPLPFVTASLRHHFPSSPLPFFTTSLRHHFPSSPPRHCMHPYSFVMYCYVMYSYTIYRPSSFQVSEFYLSVTRKYCFPTSFDNFLKVATGLVNK